MTAIQQLSDLLGETFSEMMIYGNFELPELTGKTCKLGGWKQKLEIVKAFKAFSGDILLASVITDNDEIGLITHIPLNTLNDKIGEADCMLKLATANGALTDKSIAIVKEVTHLCLAQNLNPVG
jgi:hypothetical protein